MSNVMSRLTTTFDTSKFGSDLNLSEKALSYLNSKPLKIPDSIKSDLSSGAVSRTDYFVNPVIQYVSPITSNVNSIIQICTFDPVSQFPLATQEVKDLANTSNSFLTQLNLFLDHTNRISGVSEISTNEEGQIKPNYSMCIGTGGLLLTIVAETDGVSDSSPILNNFTSLYITDELSDTVSSISNFKSILEVSGTSTTPSQVNEIIQIIEDANTLIYTRRTSDENYFYSSQQILGEYQLLNSVQNSGSTERSLINSKIGTPKLKNIVGG
jgi:hypothetical protein